MLSCSVHCLCHEADDDLPCHDLREVTEVCVASTLGNVTQQGSVVPEQSSAVMPGTTSHDMMQASPQALQRKKLQNDHMRFKIAIA